MARMSDKNITSVGGGHELEQFDPDRHRLKVAAFDYSIEEAKRIKDWPALEDAVDAKIEEQCKFVAWWNGAVGGRGGYKKPRSRFLALTDAEDLTGMKQQRVSDLGRRLRQPDKYRERLLGAEFLAALLEAVDVRGTKGTGENEWFTPAEYIERARKVLGEIDLDPASHPDAQRVVQAKQFITKHEHEELGGLGCEWAGNIWLNPPYAQPLIDKFATKMAEEWRSGRISAAIMLTHNYTDTAWFHRLAEAADAICFTRGRIKFYEPDGSVAAPTQGQAFFYFGAFVKLFAQEFASTGFVVVPWR
jgi:phage N-6-adenine-methyltransferase